MNRSTLPTMLVVGVEVRSQEALRREFVHIVLCDQRMPGVSGFERLARRTVLALDPCVAHEITVAWHA